MTGSPTSPWNRLLPPLLAGFLALLLLLAATGGPDCLQYLDWSRAAQSGDIAEIPGDLRSPTGLPLTQWSHGPGMLFALPYLSPTRHLVSDGPFAPVRDFRFMGWQAALALWCGLLGILRRATGGDSGIAIFTAIAAFAGTHLGFYSFVHSSEILSFGCLALIGYLLLARGRLSGIEMLGIGVLAGCLVLIRPHLVVYLPLILGLLIWRVPRQDPGSSFTRRMTRGLLVAVPIMIALAQVAWVNRWMTGSLLRSTYSFGDGTFRSLDLARPEWIAVLLHPWHGLLVYHPLFLLGFALVVAGIFRGPPLSRRIHLGIAVTLLVHLYIQAAWYCWWLGLWSLGNRGLGVAALLLLPVLAHAISEARPRGRLALGAGTVICSLWSLLLMVQGHTNFVTWRELIAGQASTARAVAPVLLAAVAASWVVYRLIRGRDREGRLLAAAIVLLAILLLDHLALRVAVAVTGTADGAPVALFRLCVAALAPLLALVKPPPRETVGRTAHSALGGAIAVMALALFLWTGALFMRLAVRTERVIRAGGEPGDGPVATFQVPEVQECYREYLRVPGFEEKKRALRDFLDRSEAP